MITFDANGGTGKKRPLIVIAGKDAILPDCSGFSKSGYAFDSWNTKDDGTGEKYFEESEFNTDKKSLGITLYAKWIATTVPGDTLAEKLNWLYGNAVNGGNYLVTVKDTESISGFWLVYGKKKVTITLTGGTVLMNNNDIMFGLESNVTLVLEDVTLDGRNNNNNWLVYISGGTLIMNNDAVITRSSGTGVAVHGGGKFIMNGGTISNNSPGGINVVKSTFEMHGGNIFGNIGDGCVGGVWVDNGTFKMTGGSINKNTADWGGGVNIWESTFEMTGGKIFGNTALTNGGGVHVDNRGTFTMTDGEIYGNTAEIGGGVYVNNGATFTMRGGKIYDGNKAGDGGGVCVDGDGTFTMTNGKIYDNTATRGSGVSVDHNGIFYMKGGEIYNNNNDTSEGIYYYGGGVHIDGTFNMSAGKIYGNTAPGGGGVNVYLGTFNMTGGEIYKNTANQLGGGVNVQSLGKFTKRGGIIRGYNDDPANGNVVKNVSGVVQPDHGHAVCVGTGGDILYRRETTAGPNMNMSYDGNGSGSGSGF